MSQTKCYKYDFIVIGAGMSGIAFAIEAISKNPDLKIALIEKGKFLQDRICPIAKSGKCKKCKTCSIMSGFAGAGAFSDAKFNISTEYGGWINDYMSDDNAIFYMNKLDKILCKYIDEDYKKYKPNIKLKREALKYDLHLLSGKVRHFGTEGIYKIMTSIQNKILNDLSSNIDYLQYDITPSDIDIDKKQIIINGTINKYNNLVLALGRSGSKTFKEFCDLNHIKTENNQIDIGVRVEVPRIICEDISKKIYEPKITYLTKKHRDIVRTFCFNSGGEVVTENTDGILTVNGHANHSESLKTENSNFAILSTHQFTEPFNEPIEYLQSVAKLANMLGSGKIIAQLFGDLVDGRRSTQKRIDAGTVKPTLKSYAPGDISLALPSAAMDNIIEMIYQLDKFIPGIANHDTILYGIEAKYYSCKPVFKNKNTFEVVDNVYAIGDGAGVSRSLSQAGAIGLYLADKLGDE